jgi:CarD family transcriptional regulator
MQFSVGDKVVHPYHGPGRIVSVARRELLDGDKRYYVIEIPGQELTVHVPVRRAEALGVRRAISESRLPRVLRTLRARPRPLPEDYKVRQEQICAELKTRKALKLARVVRDLTWHRERSHLTRKDNEYLREGWDLLAAEIALVSGDDMSAASQLIEATMNDAVGRVVH